MLSFSIVPDTTKATGKQQTTQEESLDEILESLTGIAVTPSAHQLQNISYNISKKIIDIIKSAYNERRDLTVDEISLVKEEISQPLFNPNKYVSCKYQCKLESIKDVVVNIAFKPNILVETLVSGETKNNTISKKRPIDLLVEIAHSLETIELVVVILKKGVDPILRDRELFSLIEHALISNNPQVLKVVLDHIGPESLTKALDGNIRGTVEEGWKAAEVKFCPVILCLSLGKELHAIELARQDKDIGQRIVELNIEGIETFVTLSIYGKALKHKAFKFIKSLFDNPHYNNFRKLVYADQIGMYNDKNYNN